MVTKKKIAVIAAIAALGCASPALAQSFNQMDAPDHTRIRALVVSAFSRRNVEERRERALDLLRPHARDEDDGWVLSYVYDAERNASDVVILDAKDFAGPPVAIVSLPARVPFGFHGNWLPDRA